MPGTGYPKHVEPSSQTRDLVAQERHFLTHGYGEWSSFPQQGKAPQMTPIQNESRDAHQALRSIAQRIHANSQDIKAALSRVQAQADGS